MGVSTSVKANIRASKELHFPAALFILQLLSKVSFEIMTHSFNEIVHTNPSFWTYVHHANWTAAS